MKNKKSGKIRGLLAGMKFAWDNKALFGKPMEIPVAHEMLINASTSHYALTTASYLEWVELAYKKNEIINGAINLIINTFNEAAVQVVDADGELLDMHPTHLILQHMNDIDTQKQFFKRLLLYYYLGDVVYIQKVFTRGHKLTELGLLRPDKVEILVRKDNAGIGGYKYRPNDSIEEILFDKEEIIFINSMDPADRLKGWSSLKSLARRIETDNELTDHVKAVIENRGEPGSILKVPEELDPRQAKVLSQSFDDRFSGLKKGKTMVLQGGMEYQSIGMSFRDLEADILFNTQEAKILSTLGIPLSIYNSISGQGASTFDNMRTSYKMFWRQTIIPLQNMVADYLSNDDTLISRKDKAKGIKIVFDRTNVDALQEQQDEKSNRARLDYQVGLITLNEARLIGGYEDIENGDELRSTMPEESLEEPVEEEEEKADVITPEIKEVKQEPLNWKDMPVTMTDCESGRRYSTWRELLEEGAMDSERGLIEDKKDTETADKVLAAIESGEEKVLDLHEVKKEMLQIGYARKDILHTLERKTFDNEISEENQLLMDYKTASTRLKIADSKVFDYYDMINKHLSKHISESLKVLKQFKSVESKGINPDSINNEIRALRSQWEVDLEEDNKELSEILMTESANEAVKESSLLEDYIKVFVVGPGNEIIVVAAGHNSATLAKRVTKTSYTKIQAVIDRSFEEGLSLSKTEKALRGLGEDWSKNRAKVTARTETVRAANQGARIGYKASGVTELRYSAVMDDRTSEICQFLDGRIVGVDKSFLESSEGFIGSNGKQVDLSYTEGGVQEPPAHPNCRSVIVPVIR